jgi:hypothetical protein
MPARRPTAATAQRGTPIGKQQTVTLSPPAYQVRQAAGLSLPKNPAGWIEGLGPAIGGALISGVFSGALPAYNRWLGYVITLGLGAFLGVTSPIGTWPEGLGAGMTATSLFGLYLIATGQEVTTT